MMLRFGVGLLLWISLEAARSLAGQSPVPGRSPASSSQTAPPPLFSPAEFEKQLGEARAAFQTDQLEKSLQFYEKLSSAKSSCAECWWYVGAIHYHLGNFGPAGRAFNRFVSLEPTNGQGWGFLGICEFKTTRFELALQHIEKARTLGLGDNDELKDAVRYHHAVLLNYSGNFEFARVLLLQNFAASNKESEAVILALGLADLRISTILEKLPSAQREMAREVGRAAFLGYSKRIAEATTLYEELVEKYRGRPNVAYAYGVSLLEGQQHEKAMTYFRRELERDANHLPALLQIAWILVLKNQVEEAREYVQKGLRLNPQSFAAHYLNGRIFLGQRNYSEAANALEKAISLAPDSANAYFSLMQAYRRLNRLADAERTQEIFEKLEALQARAPNAPVNPDGSPLRVDGSER